MIWRNRQVSFDGMGPVRFELTTYGFPGGTFTENPTYKTVALTRLSYEPTDFNDNDDLINI